MDVVRWNRIESVFEAAVGMAPAERDAFLATACEDEDVRREVQALLEADGHAGEFLEEPVVQVPDPAELTRPTLAPGMMLSRRFRLVEFLAAGGMGEVYEAEDLELGEHVALKIVRPEMARDEVMMQRFRREVLLARQVTHPSVCRCHELHHETLEPGPATGHPGASKPSRTMGRARSLTFLSMELIRGETLAAFLEREGPLTTAQALPILEQIASALTAAHERGIVHRDLKPANVMLDRSGPALRVVVMDFGLALSPRSGTDAWITRRGQVLGTPACMAPEQLMGGEVSPATDIYALGVLMYRMLTGRTPFEADDTRVVAFQRLREPPPSPRRYVSDLDPRWERVILRCLERLPGARYASAREVLASLRQAAPPARARGWRTAAAVLGSVALAGVVTGTLVLVPSLRLAVPSRAPQDVTRRALDLVQHTEREELLLAKARAHEAAHEWEQAEADYRRLTTLRPDGVDHHLRLATVQVRAGQADQALNELDELARRGDHAPRVAGEIALIEAEAAELAAQYPRSLEAARRALAHGDRLGDDLLRAHAHYREARAHWRLGAPADALNSAGAAAALYETTDDQLGQARVLALQANVREDQARLDEAATLYERARGIYDELGYREGSLEVLINASVVDARKGDHDGALAMLDAAASIAAAIRDRDGEARALHNRAWVHKEQGAYAPARLYYERARQKAEEIGNESIQSSAMSGLASILRMQGKLREAAAMEEKAQHLARTASDRESESRRLNNLGLTLRLQGDLSGALRHFDGALAAAEALGDPRGVAQRLTHIATILRMQGKFDEAQARLEQALAVHENITDPSGRAFTLRSLGLLWLARGNLVEARRALDEALAVGESTERAERLLTQRARAALALAEGDLDQAERLAREVINGRTALAHTDEALDGWLLVARIELRRARVAESRAALRQAESLARDKAELGLDLERGLRTRLIAAELRAAAGERDQAEADLEAVERDARAAGMGELVLEVRTAQAALAMSAILPRIALSCSPWPGQPRDSDFASWSKKHSR